MHGKQIARWLASQGPDRVLPTWKYVAHQTTSYPVETAFVFTAYYWPGVSAIARSPVRAWDWFVSGGIRFFERRKRLSLRPGTFSHVGLGFRMKDGTSEFHSAREGGWAVEGWGVLGEQAAVPGGMVEAYWLPVTPEQSCSLYVSSLIASKMNVEYDFLLLAYQLVAQSLFGKAVNLGVPATQDKWNCSEGVFRLAWPVIPEWLPPFLEGRPDFATPEDELVFLRENGLHGVKVEAGEHD